MHNFTGDQIVRQNSKNNTNSGLQSGSANLHPNQKPKRQKTALETMRETADSLHSNTAERQILHD